MFANCLALAADESWIIVAETGRHRLRRFWLKGTKAGKSETFADLPGFPDNCSKSADGLIWAAIAAPKNPAVEKVHQMPMLLRKIVARLPQAIQPKPHKVAWVMAFDANANVVHDYCWSDGDYSMGTGVCQHGGTVYLSSLSEKSILAFDLPSKR